MKNSVSKLINFIVLLGGIALLVYEIYGNFILSYDSSTGLVYDGLGRQLVESPLIIRMVFGSDKLWAGFKWFIVDASLFWILIAIGLWLLRLSKKLKE